MSLSDQLWNPATAQVTVLQARGLRIKGKNGTNDAYAVMQLGKEKFQTSVAEKCVAPVWKEEASFDMPSAHQGGTERGTLHVHVLHRALVGPDKLLGQAVINLLQLSEDQSRDKTQWFKLLDKSGKPDKDRGEVLVDIQFTRNNMTASMFDISAAGKSRSRLSKFKDKVRGKKKEDSLSETSSNVVPACSQVMTDSEDEGGSDGDGAAGREPKKKSKRKSLFSHKTNLQKSLSQSMSVLPGKHSTLSGSMSSGLNVEASEGKKKFKFLSHKRTGSSDKKDQKLVAEQSNLCINGSHVYCEEPAPRTSRASSNFSLASSGVGSMDDVPDSSPPSVGSRRSVRHSSPWTEEDEEEEEEEETIKMSMQEEDEEMFRRQELEKLAEEESRMEEEERKRTAEDSRRSKEEDQIRMDEEKRRQDEKMRTEQERLKEERKRREDLERMEEELRMEKEARRLDEERKRVEEENIRLEKERLEEEKRMIQLQEEQERIRQEEVERMRFEEEKAEQERKNIEEEEQRVRKEQEYERLRVEQRELEEEEKRRRDKARLAEEEERQRKEEEELEKAKLAEKRRLEEEERQRREEEELEKAKLAEKRRLEEDERQRREEEELEKAKLAEKRRLEEDERQRREEEELEKAKLAEKRRLEEEERQRREEEELEKAKLAEKKRREEEEEEEGRRREYERLRVEQRELEEEEKRRRDKERLAEEEEERQRKEEEELEKAKLAEKRRLEEEERQRREEEELEKVKLAEKRRLEEEERQRREEEELEKVKLAEKRRLEEEERQRREEEELEKAKLAEKRQEERQRREEAELEKAKLAEKRRREEEERQRREEEELEKVEKRRLEEEERQKREEKLDKERLVEEDRRQKEEKRRQEEEKGMEEAQRHFKTSSNTQHCTDVTSTNPFEESDEDNPFEDVSECTVTSARQRCKLPVERNTCSFGEKDVGTTQREKRQAPKPPRMNSSERQQAAQHEPQVNKPSGDKDIKTASILPQQAVQKINPVIAASSHTNDRKTDSSSGKKPAPQRPGLSEEILLPKSSQRPILKSKQPTAGSSLNPFEDNEEEDTLNDYLTTTAASAKGSPPMEPGIEKETVSEIKTKSSKTAHAPTPPARNTHTLSTDTSSKVTVCDLDEGKICAPVPETLHKETVQEKAVKKDAPTAPSRRLLPVRPLSPLDQLHISAIQEQKDDKPSGELLNSQGKENVKDTGPYALLTREELISLMFKQESQLLEKSKKISELEQYIDQLLVRVIEEAPNILMTMTPLK